MKKDLGKKIWIYSTMIIAMGLVALYSAAMYNVRVPHKVFYDQLSCVFLGLIIMYLVGRLDYRRFYDISYLLYALNIILLIMVLTGGRHALGARRWLEIAGISFQPSEMSKLCLILILGRYFANRRPALSFDFLTRAQLIIRDLMLPLLITAVMAVLIFKQPDLGTSILLLGICIVMLFASGIEIRYLLGLFFICLSVLPFAWHLLKPYQKDRLLVFPDPNVDPLGAGYTVIQSRIAVGSGQLFGKGWLAGTQNQLNFLPERHTDFIFSVVGEEWGFFGSILMVYFYFLLIKTGLDIASQVQDKFGTLVAVGIVAILTLQVVINIGMVMGLFPVVGITLPMVSYGRSSFLIFMIMLGFLLNLSKRRTIF